MFSWHLRSINEIISVNQLVARFVGFLEEVEVRGTAASACWESRNLNPFLAGLEE
jgi:hypothetical protein